MKNQLDQELDNLVENLDTLITVKSKEYAPKVTNFVRAINKLITNHIKKEPNHGKNNQNTSN